jgi:predicted DsbA family dithiol-disulfide isomerase
MTIDVFHDTVCPWCRIGKAHLKNALSQWEGEEPEVAYHAFFLNPDIPEEGYDFSEYMRAKGGGQVPLEQWFDAPRRMGREAGLTFNFESITRAPNSTRSHELIALTPEEHREEMIDALYTAYFEHGRDIGSLDVLLEIAEEQGLDPDRVTAELENRTMRERIHAEYRAAGRIGVTGVPFFVINRRLAFSGAQKPETVLEVLREATERSDISAEG